MDEDAYGMNEVRLGRCVDVPLKAEDHLSEDYWRLTKTVGRRWSSQDVL